VSRCRFHSQGNKTELVYFLHPQSAQQLCASGKQEYMFRTKVTLLSLTLPVGTWQAWAIVDHSPLVIRVAFAVLASFGIFMAILAATEFVAVTRRARAAFPRTPASFVAASRRRRVAPAAT
jgi:hypothetical protein